MGTLIEALVVLLALYTAILLATAMAKMIGAYTEFSYLDLFKAFILGLCTVAISIAVAYIAIELVYYLKDLLSIVKPI